MHDYYTEVISRILELLAAGELYSPWAVETDPVHRYLPDMMPLLPGTNDKKFYLRHPDDAGFYIMVDDFFNITGLIDWEWSQSTPSAVAFSSPSWLWDVGDCFDGSNELSDGEFAFAEAVATVGGDETPASLEKYAHDGRGPQRFSFLVGYEFYENDFVAFMTMFDALRRFSDVDGDLSWDDWPTAALKRHAQDHRLQALLPEASCRFRRSALVKGS
jgi:hypothetical protein